MLIECWECSMNCSDKARTCPYCGAPDPHRGKERRADRRLGWRIVGGVWFIVLVAVALVAIS